MWTGSGELSSPMRFDDYQVYRIMPQTVQQLEALKELEDGCTNYNFWSYVSAIERPVDIMVSPDKKSEFLEFLESENLGAELWIENVQERIDMEKCVSPRNVKKYDWKRYPTLKQLYVWLDSLVKKYPGIVSPVVGGCSYEGRQIKGVKVSYKPRGNPNAKKQKSGVFLEGGIHAREWISPATVTYILNQLLSDRNAKVRALAESRVWYVFPCVNPDGYHYSHVANRMWRKNRKPHGEFFGVDLNRNWNYHWMEGRASRNPESDTFAGIAPFSEIESRSLAKYISSIADSLEVYLAFHSYAQKLLIPFGHKGPNKPANHMEHQKIGIAAAESLASRYGTIFKVGNRAETLYTVGGVSADWVKGVHKNIRLAFTYELRDTGRYGFLLPPQQIIPTGRETLDSIIRIFAELEEKS